MSLMDKNSAEKEAHRRTQEDGKEREVYQNPVPLGPWWIRVKEVNMSDKCIIRKLVGLSTHVHMISTV